MTVASRFAVALAALAALVSLAAVPAAHAQIPDKFTNLKVFPKDIQKQELIGSMRRMSMALGARCDFCHAEAKTGDKQGLDFASDDKKEKKIARGMLKMVMEINSKLMPTTGVDSPMQVGCVTCHRGLKQPDTLDGAMMKAATKGGVPAAVALYDSLRAGFYGAGGYDFRPRSLSLVAEWLAGEKKDVEGAIQIMQLSLKQDPNVGESYGTLGRLYAQKGDKEAAMAAYKQALAIDPDDRRTKHDLEELEKAK